MRFTDPSPFRHLLISGIDYLDRESLAALIDALKAFEGGVLVITHNRDFSESLCTEYVISWAPSL